jgi:hypothetical protein
MNRIIRWSLLYPTLVLSPLWDREVSAQTIDVASDSSIDLQSALNSINGLDDPHVSKSPARNQ